MGTHDTAMTCNNGHVIDWIVVNGTTSSARLSALTNRLIQYATWQAPNRASLSSIMPGKRHPIWRRTVIDTWTR